VGTLDCNVKSLQTLSPSTALTMTPKCLGQLCLTCSSPVKVFVQPSLVFIVVKV